MTENMATDDKNPSAVAIVEPFFGGSHKQLVELLVKYVSGCEVFTQTPKKWHWRARTSALHFALTIPECHHFKVLFCSSVLNLAELVALRPDFVSLRKIIYFHENQLVYPVRKSQDRDFQYGYNQILSCLVADVIVFNSHFNLESFLKSVKPFLRLMPDYRPKGLEEKIRPKCRVLYFPIEFPVVNYRRTTEDKWERTNGDPPVIPPLHIVWPHRWEHDKDPELFFRMLYQLLESGLPFEVSVLGESSTDHLSVFDEALQKLGGRIKNWGFLDSKEAFYQTLADADVVVSTARHEFFGVAITEAAYLGCYPLVPNRLVYPEIFPAECVYNTPEQLLKRLKNFCRKPELARNHKLEIEFDRFAWNQLSARYLELFDVTR